MRVLVVTHSERTHLLGLVPLAWAFRARGDDVLVAVQPSLAAAGVAAGLPVVAVGRDNQFWRVARMQGRDSHIPPLGAGDSWESLRDELHRVVPWWWRMVNDPMADDLVALCRRWRPDLVLWGAVTFAGALAAEACGARHARVLFGADLAGSLYARFLAARPAGESEDPLLSWLGRSGIPVDGSTAMGQVTIDYLPPSLSLGTEALPVQYVPANGRSVLPAWLRRPPERPRVCVTLGHFSFDHGAVGLTDVLTGAADQDVEVEVVATVPPHARQDLGRLPPNVRLESFVPLDALAATCSAVVNHGGGGTVCTTARHAVPQLVIPRDYDAPVLGEHLAACGAGRHLAPAEVTHDAVRSTVSALLTEPRIKDAARALRREILAMPAPSELADTLTAWPGREAERRPVRCRVSAREE